MNGHPDPTEVSLPVAALEQIDLICLEFESAWKTGKRPRIEDYLDDKQGAERGELLRQLLLLDLDYRRLKADQPILGEYQARFPDDGKLVADVFGEFSVRAASSPPPGTKVRYFGDYELLEEVGHGGMGVVYKAQQMSLNRIVGLKMILPGRLTNDAAVKRFRAEAEAAANLQHPNIVAVHEAGVHDRQHYFSMDYVEGQSLAEIVRDNPLPAKQAAEYVQKIAEAVHYAHQQGTLHRDLKPSNVLIDTNDEPQVTDFGLAKRVENDSGLTGSSEILGTPSYMAPEQAEGKHERIGAASDVYSLGAVLYELLTGRPVFRAATPVETLRLVIDTEPVSPRLLNPKVPRDLETICLKCLEKEPPKRYATAEALADDLERFLGSKPIQARPISLPARTWRWCRRKPALATAGSVVIAAMIGTLLALAVAFFTAARARDDAIRHSATLLLEDGYDKCVQGDPSRGLLSLARALREASRTESPELEYSIRMQLAGWSRDLHRLEWMSSDHQSAVLAGAFTPDGKTALTSTACVYFGSYNGPPFITGFDAGELQLRDAATGKLRRAIPWQEPGDRKVPANSGTSSEGAADRFVCLIAVPSDGKTALTFEIQGPKSTKGGIGTLQLVDLGTGEVVGSRLPVTLTIGLMAGVAFAPGSKTVVVTDGEEGHLYEIGTWRPLGRPMAFSEFSESNRPTDFVAISPDGTTVVACSLCSQDAQIWDARTGELVKTLEDSIGYPAAFSPDGELLAIAIDEPKRSELRLFDLSTGHLTRRFVKPSGPITAIAFSPDGQFIAAGSVGERSWSYLFNPRPICEVQVWAIWSQIPLGHPVWQEGGITSITFSSDGETLLTTSGDMSHRPMGKTQLWRLCTPHTESTPISLRMSGRNVSNPHDFRGGLLSPDMKTVLMRRSSGHESRLCDAETGKPRGEPLKYADDLEDEAFSADGKTALTLETKGTVRFWDARTGLKVREDLQLPDARRPLALSPNGRVLLTGKAGEAAQLWDAATGEPVGPSLSHRSEVRAAAFPSVPT